MSMQFHLVPGAAVSRLMRSLDTISIIRDAYLAHEYGQTINPDSYFLRFDDRPSDRIIALPAAIRGASPVSGLKWIASYPDNIHENLPRASAVLILNDYETGYPLACLEASEISAVRTAASAVLAARVLLPGDAGKSPASGEAPGRRIGRLGIVGAGVIARTIVETLHTDGWTFDDIRLHDMDGPSAAHLANFLGTRFDGEVSVQNSVAGTLAGADLVILATSAGVPYIEDTTLFSPGQVVLNISLRDLSADIVLQACNIFDDIEHCMKANTSPHLAEQKSGSRAFAHGTLAGIMLGTCMPDPSRPIIFSPFGLGILDLALGQALLRLAIETGQVIGVPDFFPQLQRWQNP